MRGGDHLYIMQMGRTGAIKVGRSGDPERRLTEIQTGAPYEVRLLLVVEDQGWREQHLHREMRKFRLRSQKGEWFSEGAIGYIPLDIYDKFTEQTVEMMNSEWWKNTREPGAFG